MAKEWESYRSPSGRDKVADDIRKLRLTSFEKVRVEEHMADCAAGKLRYPTIKSLREREGLLELRIILQERSFRLIYAEVDGGLVLLALNFFRKQARRQQTDIDEAVGRYREWRREHPDRS